VLFLSWERSGLLNTQDLHCVLLSTLTLEGSDCRMLVYVRIQGGWLQIGG
jgi:hypothetical protein